MSAEAEGIAWVFILAWLGLGALVVLVLAVARYRRDAAYRKEAARLVAELASRPRRDRESLARWLEDTQARAQEREREQARDAQRWQRGRP